MPSGPMRWFDRRACDRRRPRPLVSAGDLVGVVRGLRHRFANDLQVLRGWLELGRAEKASAHLDLVTSRIEAESALGHLDLPDLEAVLLVAKERAASEGVRMSLGTAVYVDPVYAAAAAAAEDRFSGKWCAEDGGEKTAGTGPVGPPGTGAEDLAAAVSAVLGVVTREAAAKGVSEVRVEVGAPGGGHPEVVVRLPARAVPPPEAVEAALASAGFSLCRQPREGSVGIAYPGGEEGEEVELVVTVR
ncbi:MAG TPA: hypothetical protein DHW14_01720 [Clostridiales bacterium]|nr:hypothetical protein [Clostridiales bacterium]